MRRAAHVDANQRVTVEAFRAMGATVEHLHSVGGGCPDLIVSYGGVSHFVEVKDGNKAPSRRKLRKTQVDWHAATRGTVHVVACLADVQTVFGRLRKEAIAIKVMDMNDAANTE